MKRKISLLLSCVLLLASFSACNQSLEKTPVDSSFSEDSYTDSSASSSFMDITASETESSDIFNSSESSEKSNSSDEEKKSKIVLNAYNGASMDICHETIRLYLDNMSNPNVLAGMLKEELPKKEFLTTQNISFSWSAENVALPYSVFFSDNINFENAYVVETNACQLSDVGYFIPGKQYYWRVTDGNGVESAIDSFAIKDSPVRFITADGMWNVRDCGGWETETGEKVKYGLLYRGDQPTNAKSAGKRVFEHLGINGEIDLRFGSSLTSNQFKTGAPFLNAGIKYYYQIVPGEYDYSEEQTNNIGKIFKFLADENNYPVYFHCTYGKDRTGTLALLIQGLLGVKYEQIMADFELSSYGYEINDLMARNTIVSDGTGGYKFKDAKDDPWGYVGRLYYVLRKNYAVSDTQPFSEVVETYLTQVCGVSAETIASFRKIMLEK